MLATIKKYMAIDPDGILDFVTESESVVDDVIDGISEIINGFPAVEHLCSKGSRVARMTKKRHDPTHKPGTLKEQHRRHCDKQRESGRLDGNGNWCNKKRQLDEKAKMSE